MECLHFLNSLWPLSLRPRGARINGSDKANAREIRRWLRLAKNTNYDELLALPRQCQHISWHISANKVP